ncbi:MAG: hypothetical protein ACJAU9_001094 [Lentimonas sp.]|jgi:hypothetical protein
MHTHGNDGAFPSNSYMRTIDKNGWLVSQREKQNQASD